MGLRWIDFMVLRWRDPYRPFLIMTGFFCFRDNISRDFFCHMDLFFVSFVFSFCWGLFAEITRRPS